MDKVETRAYGELRTSGRTIKGFIPYGKLSDDLGGFKEKLKNGCFRDSLKGESNVKSFWGHDQNKPLGSTEAKTLIFRDFDEGLRFEINPPQTSWGNDALESIKRGDTKGCSFGFSCTKGGDKWETVDNVSIRTILTAKLIEVSPVSFPAYPDASVRNLRSNTMDIKELIERRNKVVQEMHSIEDQGPLTGDRLEKHAKLDGEFNDLSGRIRSAQMDQILAQSQSQPHRPDPGDASDNWTIRTDRRPQAELRFWNNNTSIPQSGRQQASDFHDFLTRGLSNLPYEVRARLEARGLQSQSDVAGGFIVAPEEFTAELIRDLSNQVLVRRFAKVISMTTAQSLTAAELVSEIGDVTWSAELSAGENDETMAYNKRMLTPHPLARYIKVSKKLIRQMPQVEEHVRSSLAASFATVEENAFINGSGSNQPLGVMVPSDQGISTGRNVTTTASGAIKADDLWNCIFSLKAQYRRGSRWLFSRQALQMIRKLKDGQGNYLWSSGISGGSPDNVCGLPYDESEYMPSSFVTGQYIGLLANWQYYWIVDALDVNIQVLTELYALTNQNAYVARKETDAAPIQENGFSRLILG